MNGNEQDMLRKITALLAKAEGTDNEHEASAFFEKAQELMVRHAIEEAQVRAAVLEKEGRKVESPVKVDYMYATNDSHQKGRIALLLAVAKAQHVKVAYYRASTSTSAWFARRNGVTDANKYAQWVTLVGYAQDIENLKVLYTSLTIQWARFVRQDVQASGYSKREEYGFRTGHLVGFASRIRSRFQALNDRVVAEVKADALMVNKDAEIDAFYNEAFGIVTNYCWAVQPKEQFAPHQKKARFCIKAAGHVDPHSYTYLPTNTGGRGRRERQVDYNGYYAGQSAADRADLGLTRMGNDSKQIKG